MAIDFSFAQLLPVQPTLDHFFKKVCYSKAQHSPLPALFLYVEKKINTQNLAVETGNRAEPRSHSQTGVYMCMCVSHCWGRRYSWEGGYGESQLLLATPELQVAGAQQCICYIVSQCQELAWKRKSIQVTIIVDSSYKWV